jgi:hypothetical protein
MDVQKDFADLCSLLNERGVEFLIVGGYAVGYHGAPRFTGTWIFWFILMFNSSGRCSKRLPNSDSRLKTSGPITF